MRVLVCSQNLHPTLGGGVAERAFQVTRELATVQGVEMVLLTLGRGLSPQRRQDLGRAEFATLPVLSRRFFLPFPRLGLVRRLVRAADVIHLMGHWSVLNALVYWCAVLYEKPHVVSPCGALPMVGRSKLLKRTYQWIVGRRMTSRADRIIAITEDEKRSLRRCLADGQAVAVIPNGIRPEEYRHRDDAGFRRRYGLADCPFILFLGRLSHIKGPDLLVEAFAGLRAEFPDLVLVFAGPDGAMRRQLEVLARTYGIEERVRFLGFLDAKRRSWALHAARLLVIPSRREAMSVAVLDAGAAGTGVVVTDQCGLGAIGEMGAGIVVPASVEGLRSGIEAGLSDQERTRQMGRRLKAFTMERCTWRTVSREFLEVFKSVHQEHRARNRSRR